MTQEIAKIIRKSSGKDNSLTDTIAYAAVVTIVDAMIFLLLSTFILRTANSCSGCQ